jgi:hypothetical protein
MKETPAPHFESPYLKKIGLKSKMVSGVNDVFGYTLRAFLRSLSFVILPTMGSAGT